MKRTSNLHNAMSEQNALYIDGYKESIKIHMRVNRPSDETHGATIISRMVSKRISTDTLSIWTPSLYLAI